MRLLGAAPRKDSIMTIRLPAALVAATLLAAAPTASAFAQGLGVLSTARVGRVEAAPPAGAYDDLVTGSIARRGIDASAKGSNAEQPERVVPQYGDTAGGPLR
jgi:hypothetical protein